MKLHYMGKYDLNPESIPTKPHRPNCVKFKEPENSKKLGRVATIISAPIAVLCFLPIFMSGVPDLFRSVALGSALALLAMFPHEILHAICFKEDVYLFTNLKQGQMFVAGSEDMSKARFVFMSLLPNIVLGLLPYVLYLLNPNLIVLGAFGAINLAGGSGDYLNIFNAITQMPAGAKTYLHQFNSYWYLPEK